MADVFRWVSVREACLYCKIQRIEMSKEMIFFFRSAHEGNVG